MINNTTKNWMKRYLPAEIVGLLMALGISGLVYQSTGSEIAAAYAAVFGENLGFYPMIAIQDMKHYRKKGCKNWLTAFGLSFRNLCWEFGIAEIIDSLLVRPMMMYMSILLFTDALLGKIVAKFLADAVFYVPVLIAYEARKKYFE